MLFEQRVLIEMRLQTVKLEIFEHVAGEFARLRNFISTLAGSPVSTPLTAPHNVYTDAVPSSFHHEVHVELVYTLKYYACMSITGFENINLVDLLLQYAYSVGDNRGNIDRNAALDKGQHDDLDKE